MYKVKIPSGNFHIERQLPISYGCIWGNCEFVFDDAQDYDYYVTLDSLNDVTLCNVDKQHRLLFLGEPPYIKQYNQQYLNQFGHVFTCNEALIRKGWAHKLFPLLPWMLGMSFQNNSHKTESGAPYMTYDDFKTLKVEEKRLNKCCLITSNKKFTSGHRDRVRFADYVLEHCSDIIDVYGNGYNPIPDKFDVLRRYKYAIVIENCRYPDYWTEKLGDCYMAGGYPLYHGCLNINEYYDSKSYTLIDVRNIEATIDLIRSVLASDVYEQNVKYIEQSKQSVLNIYNIFPQIDKVVTDLEMSCSTIKTCNNANEVLYPLKWTFYDKIKMELVRNYNIKIGF